MLPSGPVVIPNGTLPAAGSGNSAMPVVGRQRSSRSSRRGMSRRFAGARLRMDVRLRNDLLQRYSNMARFPSLRDQSAPTEMWLQFHGKWVGGFWHEFEERL